METWRDRNLEKARAIERASKAKWRAENRDKALAVARSDRAKRMQKNPEAIRRTERSMEIFMRERHAAI